VILREQYRPEILLPHSNTPAPPGTDGELILTSRYRTASPLIRYRTGDIVQLHPEQQDPARLRLRGGIRGRLDDMLHIRGNNIYPSAIEDILRQFPEISEFRLHVQNVDGPLLGLHIDYEGPTEFATTIRQRIQQEFLFRPEIRNVPRGTLPRSEMKARRVVREAAPPLAMPHTTAASP
ncbi:MAG: phenylacetate--CoA ligase family protein, partial [Gemmataceae bacterium]